MECTALELKQKLSDGEDFLLLDVRTLEEHALARVEPSLLVPLHELAERLEELETWRDREVICLCHHGIRSAQACMYLTSRGFSRVRNLNGGIDAYAAEADPGMHRY